MMDRSGRIKIFLGILAIVLIISALLGPVLANSVAAIRALDRRISELSLQVEKFNKDAIETEEFLLKEYLANLNAAQDLDKKARQSAKKVKDCNQEFLSSMQGYDGEILRKAIAHGSELSPGFSILSEARKVDKVGYEFASLTEEYLPHYQALLQAMIKPSEKPAVSDVLSDLSEKRNSLKVNVERIEKERNSLKLWEIEFSQKKSEIYKMIAQVDFKEAEALLSQSKRMRGFHQGKSSQAKKELEGFEEIVDKIVEKADAYSTKSKKLISTLEVLKKVIENSGEITNGATVTP